MSRPGTDASSDREWRHQAACRDHPTERFTGPASRRDTAAALATCASCSVRTACLTTALTHEDTADVGIWGGTTVHTRRRIRAGEITIDDALDGAGVPVGTASMARLPNDDVEVEIGWNLHPDAVGHGWAREAAAAVLARAFEHGLARVWAIMWPHNERSAAVARAIGMIDLGVRPDPWYGEPEFPDSLMFRADRP